MVAAKLDPNAWYQISETRVVNVSEKIDPNLQNTNQGLRVFPLAPQAWQFQPIGDVDGRYLVRLNISGVKDQLSVCWRANEVHLSGTIGCMRKTESDESQQWDISEWGDGSYKFSNVKNGSGYVLDVHPGSNLFMSSEIEGTEGVSAKQLAQHWVMTSERPVDDGAYSTIYTAVSTSAGTTSASATATGTAATGTPATAATGGDSSGATSISTPTSTPDNSSSSSGGLSAGAAAGIGVGVSLAAVALIGAAVFFWWRRRKANKGASVSQNSHDGIGKEGHAPGNLSPGTINASTVPSVTSPNTPHNDYYAQEAKVLGHMQPHMHAAEAGHNPIYEAPTETRYELESGLHGYGGNGPAQLDDTTRR